MEGIYAAFFLQVTSHFLSRSGNFFTRLPKESYMKAAAHVIKGRAAVNTPATSIKIALEVGTAASNVM